MLPRHIPLISVLKPGEIRVKKGGQIDYFAVGGGFLEVKKDSQVIILATTAEKAEDIDEARAIEAKKEAERLMKEAKEDIEMADAQAFLERNLARLKVAQRKRSRHGQRFINL